MAVPTNRERMASSNAPGNPTRITIPKPPYTPPPVNPKEMPAWYDRFYRELDKWVGEMNSALNITTSI